MMNNRLYRALVLSEPQLASALSVFEFVARHALPAGLARGQDLVHLQNRSIHKLFLLYQIQMVCSRGDLRGTMSSSIAVLDTI